MPAAPSNRMNHFMGAGTNSHPFGTGIAESAPDFTTRPESFSTIFPYKFEKWFRSFWSTSKFPVGVRCPSRPLEMGETAILCPSFSK